MLNITITVCVIVKLTSQSYLARDLLRKRFYFAKITSEKFNAHFENIFFAVLKQENLITSQKYCQYLDKTTMA